MVKNEDENKIQTKKKGCRCKIEIKRIDDASKSQMTFSKRKLGLIKKAHDISVLCDVDVIFVSFSPSDHPLHFCNPRRLEDVLLRYINLHINDRNYKIKNAELKLKALEQIELDEDKVAFVKNQIDFVKNQITDLRSVIEAGEKEISNFLPKLNISSLQEATWREKYLASSLKLLGEKKLAEMRINRNRSPNCETSIFTQQLLEITQNDPVKPSSSFETVDAKGETWITDKQLIMEKDPWLNGEIQRSRWIPVGYRENNGDVERYETPSMETVGDMNQQQPSDSNHTEQPRDSFGNFAENINIYWHKGEPYMFNPEETNSPPNAPIQVLSDPQGSVELAGSGSELAGIDPLQHIESWDWNMLAAAVSMMPDDMTPDLGHAGLIQLGSGSGSGSGSAVDPYFDPLESNLVPITCPHNLNGPVIPGPPRDPSSSLYNLNYENPGSYMDLLFSVMNNDNAINGQSISINSDQHLQNLEMASGQVEGSSSSIHLTEQPLQNLEMASGQVEGSSSSIYLTEQPLQTQEMASGQAEVSSSSINFTDLEMPDEEIQAMINNMWMNPEEEQRQKDEFEDSFGNIAENKMVTMEEIGIYF